MVVSPPSSYVPVMRCTKAWIAELQLSFSCDNVCFLWTCRKNLHLHVFWARVGGRGYHSATETHDMVLLSLQCKVSL